MRFVVYNNQIEAYAYRPSPPYSIFFVGRLTGTIKRAFCHEDMSNFICQNTSVIIAGRDGILLTRSVPK